jgi:anti-sigma factor RsiW
MSSEISCVDVSSLLDAYWDGELDPRRRASVGRHLETCASCSAELHKLEELRLAIRNDMPHYTTPPHLHEEVRKSLRAAEAVEPGSRFDWRPAAAIAAVLVVIVAAVAVYGTRERQIVSAELFSAHARALMGHELDVTSSDRHTVKPWFNGKLPFAPPTVDLASDGFPLEGARLDYAAGHTVAVLVYRRNLHWIDVFVWPAGYGSQPESSLTREGFNQISWTRDGFVFSAISDLNPSELNAFARLLQTRQ